jgi:dihydrofolate reductase
MWIEGWPRHPGRLQPTLLCSVVELDRWALITNNRLEMRKLKYYVACSVDRFIAHPDGSIEGLMERDTDFDFAASLKAFDVVLMGRKTYELSLRLGHSTDPDKENYVFSRTMSESPDKNVKIVSEKAIELVRELKRGTEKDIWLCGGADLATELFAENLIDEIILKVNPVLFGSGISLFSGEVKQTELELIESKTYRNSYMVLRYRVKH